MPFRSDAQRRFMWSQHPDIAKRWTKEYGSKVVPDKGAIERRMKKKRKHHGISNNG